MICSTTTISTGGSKVYDGMVAEGDHVDTACKGIIRVDVRGVPVSSG